MKKKLLIFAIIAALALSANRLWSAIETFTPPIAEGGCLVIRMPGLPKFNAKIIKNNFKDQTSLVSIRLDGVVIGAYAKWDELRAMGAREVSCK